MKINIPRVFEKSKVAATEAGQQLTELIDYVVDVSEQMIRAMRNQINFSDNFDAIVSEVTVSDMTEAIIYTNGKIPTGIYVMKVGNKDYAVDAFRWYIDENNLTKIFVKFLPALSGTTTIKIVVHFN